mmetsp:Transcript_3321/g.6823  ORF Transcript_3321/g.6823 Transcript_3321/m.6823 type:complete len:212 (-) Transcript_3321:63-698(-)
MLLEHLLRRRRRGIRTKGTRTMRSCSRTIRSLVRLSSRKRIKPSSQATTLSRIQSIPTHSTAPPKRAFRPPGQFIRGSRTWHVSSSTATLQPPLFAGRARSLPFAPCASSRLSIPSATSSGPPRLSPSSPTPLGRHARSTTSLSAPSSYGPTLCRRQLHYGVRGPCKPNIGSCVRDTLFRRRFREGGGQRAPTFRVLHFRSDISIGYTAIG